MPAVKPTSSHPTEDTSSSEDAAKSKISSKNLIILGAVSTGIAVITTAVSLIIYHNSGDIYLDRSRPGYLPDESEIQSQVESSYDFSVTGPLTESDLEEYIKHFEEKLGNIDDLKDPFSGAPLSNESLGIPNSQPSSPVDSD